MNSYKVLGAGGVKKQDIVLTFKELRPRSQSGYCRLMNSELEECTKCFGSTVEIWKDFLSGNYES